MSSEATSHQYLAIDIWASHLFCSPQWPGCWALHCELPRTGCTSFQEQGRENAIPSGPSLSRFPSLCHWDYRESAHKSRSPQGLDSSWTRDCLSCSGWIPWGCSQRPGLKQNENSYWKQNRSKGTLAHRWKYELWAYGWVVPPVVLGLGRLWGH